MTARHADGGEQLRDDIDGSHNENRVQITLEVAADAAGLDLVISDKHKDHQRPAQFGHEVCGGAPDAQQADEVGDNACGKDGAHQRDIPVKAGAHVAVNEIDQCTVDCLGHRLLAGDVGHLEPRAQHHTGHRDDGHDQPAHHKGLGDVNGAEKGHIGEGVKNFCAVDGNIHW